MRAYSIDDYWYFARELFIKVIINSDAEKVAGTD